MIAIIKKAILKNLRWIVLIIALIVFIAIAEDLFENELYHFDNTIYSAVSHFINTPITAFLKIITNIASAPFVMGICIVTLLVFKNKKYGIYMSINLGIVAISNVLLKNVFERPRPEGFRLIEETGYSFPSGHSMVSMAFYGFIIYLVYRNVSVKWLRNLLCIALFILILLIGISRIYLGVHYASDVLAGFCVSVAYLALYTNIVKEKVSLQQHTQN